MGIKLVKKPYEGDEVVSLKGMDGSDYEFSDGTLFNLIEKIPANHIVARNSKVEADRYIEYFGDDGRSYEVVTKSCLEDTYDCGDAVVDMTREFHVIEPSLDKSPTAIEVDVDTTMKELVNKFIDHALKSTYNDLKEGELEEEVNEIEKTFKSLLENNKFSSNINVVKAFSSLLSEMYELMPSGDGVPENTEVGNPDNPTTEITLEEATNSMEVEEGIVNSDLGRNSFDQKAESVDPNLGFDEVTVINEGSTTKSLVDNVFFNSLYDTKVYILNKGLNKTHRPQRLSFSEQEKIKDFNKTYKIVNFS